MQRPGAAPATRRRSGGFALIIVLWTLVLIAFVTLHLVASGKVEVRIAGNLVANAVTGAAADGAIYQAAFNLLDPQPDRRWPLDGAAHALTIGDCRVTVRLRDETALINPNLAAPALLEALLRVTGSDAARADQLAVAIGEWTGTAAAPRTQEALMAEYRAAGLDYGPPGEPLETLDELRRVLGMTPAVFEAIRPHLSLFAPAVPSLAYPDPVVRAALTELHQATRPPVRGPQQLGVETARIAATAKGPDNARAGRVAVFQIVPRSGRYIVLGWGGDLD